MRKITLLIAFAFICISYSFGQLFITELADPNNASGARFVEIYNAGASAVDLSTGWDLQRWTNGNSGPQTAKELTGTIAAGGFYIVCNNPTTFTSTYGFAADQSLGSGGPADSNGDDQIALRDPTDAIVDMFGVPGEDGSGTNHEFEDGRAERKATVTGPNATYTFAEWNIWNDTGGAGTTNLPQNAPADFDPGAWIGASVTPLISASPSVLSGFTYVFSGGGPSQELTMDVSGSNLTADIVLTAPADFEISLASGTGYTGPITLVQSGGVVAPTTIYVRMVSGLAAGDYSENIVISSTGASNKDVPCNGTVEAPATTTLPYTESFDVDLGACYTYNVAGVNTWYYYSGGQLANCNGFGGGNPEEDWLVLPGIDLDAYGNEVMTFTTSAKYGTNDANNYLKLMYSTDYSGIGDPTSATWAELSYTQPAGINNSTEVSAFSGNVDLSGITGTSVYIAFKYLSTNSPTRWGVDDIVIAETLSWYNLQWPGTPAPQPSWWNLTVYAQCWEPGVTDAAGQGGGIECWIGYSTVDENPDGSANFIWAMANYDSDAGSNDQYSTNLGAAIPMAPGTYYYVARWRFNNGPFTYGGFSSGAWDGTTNVSGVLTITPSAASSTWTGNVNDNWFDGGNWDSDVPGYNTDATIPVGLTNYPLTTAGTAMCNNLLVQSDATGDASLIEYGNLNVLGTATVERNMTADMYHSYSPSVSGLTSGLFHLPASTDLDVYLYSHNELNNGDANGGYFEITDLATPLMSMAGYAVYLDGLNAVPPVSDWTFAQVGPLNSGSFGAADNMTRTGSGTFAGFNYVGNPYPSFIDWDAVAGWTKTNMNGTVYSESNGNWATWVAPGPGTNGGSNIVAPGQGFFVEVNNAFTTGTIMMDNTVRTNTSTPYLKGSVGNYVKLMATGNDKTDEMVVRFDENATALFDGQFDGVKLAAGDNSYPQIYSIADRNLAYNALPETTLVQLGFSAGVDGEYSIQLVDVDNIPSVWLEDTFTGILTNLMSDSYTFNYSTTDNPNRFVLHFAPMAVAENAADLFNIFAFGDEVIVSTTALQNDAQIFVYNMMGQEVATAQMTENVSKLKMNNSTVYLVKVVSQQGVVSKKVFLK